jgi:hypothetical protein
MPNQFRQRILPICAEYSLIQRLKAAVDRRLIA